MDSALPADSVNDEKTDEEQIDDGPETSIEINWSNNSKQYEVVSQGDAGFNRVTRPDYSSAKHAAETHEKATGNECEISLI